MSCGVHPCAISACGWRARGDPIPAPERWKLEPFAWRSQGWDREGWSMQLRFSVGPTHCSGHAPLDSARRSMTLSPPCTPCGVLVSEWYPLCGPWLIGRNVRWRSRLPGRRRGCPSRGLSDPLSGRGLSDPKNRFPRVPGDGSTVCSRFCAASWRGGSRGIDWPGTGVRRPATQPMGGCQVLHAELPSLGRQAENSCFGVLRRPPPH